MATTLFMGRKCCYVLCLIFIFFLQQTNGAAVQVGGAVGWTNFDLATSGPPDYSTWASTQSLTVGDTVVFTFAPQYHNVYSLPTEAAYGSCDQAVATELTDGTTGSYSWAPTKGGIYYFACFKLVEGQGTHCEMGQKVALIVKDGVAAPKIAPVVAPIPAPILPPVAAPILPPVAAPVHAPALVPISAPVPALAPVTKTPAPAPASSVVPESVVGVPVPAPTPHGNAGVLSSVPAWTALFLLSALVVLGI
jgi:plastocyanin